MGEKYKAFISFKHSSEKNCDVTTKDCQMAKRLWEELKKNGVKTFFSPVSIEPGQYHNEPIDAAIIESDIFILVASRPSHLEQPQVKYEIDGFMTEVREGRKDQNKIEKFLYMGPNFRIDEVKSLAVRGFLRSDNLNEMIEMILARVKKEGKLKVDDGESEMSMAPSVVGRNLPVVPSNSKRPEKDSLKIGTVINRTYEVLSVIGRGGLGEVYLGIDRRDNKKVAIKSIEKTSVIDFSVIRQGVLKEIELLNCFDSEYFPKVYDVIETRDRLQIIMDFVEGENLQEIIHKSSLQIETIINYGGQLCDILQYLHTRSPRVIYRDLKPLNIMVQPNHKLMLIDFGTAREYKESVSEDTVLLGTVGYAAPEQFGGRGQTDERTDIYTLGVTLYHMLTGLSPCAPPYEILFEKIENASMRRIVEKCTERDPKNRYKRASDVKRDLEKLSRKNPFVFSIEQIIEEAKNYVKKCIEHKYQTIDGDVEKFEEVVVIQEEPIQRKEQIIPEYVDEDAEMILLSQASETTLLGEESPQFVAACICSNVGVIDEREQVIEVYLFNERAIEDVKNIISKNKQAIKIECSDIFAAKLYSTDVSLISSTIRYELKKYENGIGYRYWKFSRDIVLEKAKEHLVNIEVQYKVKEFCGNANLGVVNQENKIEPKIDVINTINVTFPDRR